MPTKNIGVDIPPVVLQTPPTGWNEPNFFGTGYGKNRFLGSDFPYLQDIIKKGIEGNNPLYDTLLGNAKRRIGAVTDRNIQDIKELGAQSGFRGIGANKINDAYRTEAEAVGGVADNLAMAQLNERQNMIRNLLGLNQLEGSVGMDLYGKGLSKEMFEKELKFREDNQPSWLGQLLGQLLSGGAQVGAAAILASDKKVKENIKKVGKTKSGIPIVEFNYKDDPNKTKIRGHIAQEVEKKYPNAVVKAIDYGKLPEDAVFEMVG